MATDNGRNVSGKDDKGAAHCFQHRRIGERKLTAKESFRETVRVPDDNVLKSGQFRHLSRGEFRPRLFECRNRLLEVAPALRELSRHRGDPLLKNVFSIGVRGTLAVGISVGVSVAARLLPRLLHRRREGAGQFRVHQPRIRAAQAGLRGGKKIAVQPGRTDRGCAAQHRGGSTR